MNPPQPLADAPAHYRNLNPLVTFYHGQLQNTGGSSSHGPDRLDTSQAQESIPNNPISTPPVIPSSDSPALFPPRMSNMIIKQMSQDILSANFMNDIGGKLDMFDLDIFDSGDLDFEMDFGQPFVPTDALLHRRK